MLHQLWGGTGDHPSWTFAGFLHTGDNHFHALSYSERLQARLLLARHARLSLANVENDFRAFEALHGRVQDLAHAADVLVVDRVALGLPHLLKDDLLGHLCGK